MAMKKKRKKKRKKEKKKKTMDRCARVVMVVVVIVSRRYASQAKVTRSLASRQGRPPSQSASWPVHTFVPSPSFLIRGVYYQAITRVDTDKDTDKQTNKQRNK